MLKIGDITHDQRSAAGAKAAVFQAIGATGPKEGTPQRAVLGSIAFVAANDAAVFELQDVQHVYAGYVAQATQCAATAATARAWCRQNTDHLTAQDLDEKRQRQATTLAGLRAQGTIVITRGTNPVQAQQILTHVTFGGLPLDPAIVAPPSAADADAQTGRGVKDTGAGRIEEWSLGELTGFSLDGFMLIAEADVNRVTLPRSDSATMTGEAGVCGFAAAGLSRVAILAEGRPSHEPPEKRELERISSSIGRNIAAVVGLLKVAALQHRHVTL